MSKLKRFKRVVEEWFNRVSENQSRFGTELCKLRQRVEEEHYQYFLNHSARIRALEIAESAIPESGGRYSWETEADEAADAYERGRLDAPPIGLAGVPEEPHLAYLLGFNEAVIEQEERRL
jgi:hypothetical protein